MEITKQVLICFVFICLTSPSVCNGADVYGQHKNELINIKESSNKQIEGNNAQSYKPDAIQENSYKNMKRDQLESLGHRNDADALFELYLRDIEKKKGLRIGSALSFLRRAAEIGHMEAQFDNGYLYEHGVHMHRDVNKKESVKWFRMAAQQGHIGAMVYIVHKYFAEDSEYIEKEEAIQFAILTAEHGEELSQLYMGYFYEFGETFPIDYTKAVYWYSLCAENGNGACAERLGCAYKEGRGVKKNIDEALQWFFTAARNGSPAAAAHLGRFYEEGAALKLDLVEAYAHYLVSLNLPHYMAEEAYQRSKNIKEILATNRIESAVSRARGLSNTYGIKNPEINNFLLLNRQMIMSGLENLYHNLKNDNSRSEAEKDEAAEKAMNLYRYFQYAE